ncbi:MAG: NADH-quinone oxidoreductase subunit B family protein [Thermoprotei archaeon]|nr:NADH-quinone oxidoreductase subunit B family protein [Thermoprotei archaeon]
MMRRRAFRYSPWIFHLHCGGCNGCDIELLATLTPRYDVERLGIKLVSSPRHADILVVTGPMPKHIIPFAKRVYEQVPEPKVVVAVGSCACSGGVFAGIDVNEENYALVGPIDKVFPVDVYVPGCPPKPEAIIQGIAKAIQVLSTKAVSSKSLRR